MYMGSRTLFSLVTRVAILILLSGSLAFAAPNPATGAVACEIPDPVPEAAPAENEAAATPVDGDDTPQPSRRQLLHAGLERLVQTFAACRSAGDYETLSRLVTEKYLGAVYGGGPRLTRAEFLALAGDLPATRMVFRDFGSVKLLEEGGARANVKWIVGNQLTFERLTFVEEKRRPGSWLIDTTSPLRLRPPQEHAAIQVTITGNRYNPATLTANQSTVEIRVNNADAEDHELLVLALPAGTTTSQLLWHAGPALPEGVRFLGQVTIPARAEGNIVLVKLKPGTYQIVDLLPSENGVPHLSLGMEATLTITE
jgi:hypothetical protein